MSEGFSNYGEELLVDNGLVGESVEIVLYDDSVDGLTDSDNTSAITTELSGGNYARQTHTIQSGDTGYWSGDYGFEFTVNFNLDGTTGDVDAVAVVHQGTTNVIARHLIDNPEPGPKQSVDGVLSLDQTVRQTFD